MHQFTIKNGRSPMLTLKVNVEDEDIVEFRKAYVQFFMKAVSLRRDLNLPDAPYANLLYMAHYRNKLGNQGQSAIDDILCYVFDAIQDHVGNVIFNSDEEDDSMTYEERCEAHDDMLECFTQYGYYSGDKSDLQRFSEDLFQQLFHFYIPEGAPTL